MNIVAGLVAWAVVACSLLAGMRLVQVVFSAALRSTTGKRKARKRAASVKLPGLQPSGHAHGCMQPGKIKVTCEGLADGYLTGLKFSWAAQCQCPQRHFIQSAHGRMDWCREHGWYGFTPFARGGIGFHHG